jgi:hypothetical protein
MKAHNVMEGFLEVLGRLFVIAPASFPALVRAVGDEEAAERQQQQQQQNPEAGDQQQQQQQQAPGGGDDRTAAVLQRFLDRWLSVANVTLLEGVCEGVGWLGGEGVLFKSKAGHEALMMLPFCCA